MSVQKANTWSFSHNNYYFLIHQRRASLAHIHTNAGDFFLFCLQMAGTPLALGGKKNKKKNKQKTKVHKYE